MSDGLDKSWEGKIFRLDLKNANVFCWPQHLFKKKKGLVQGRIKTQTTVWVFFLFFFLFVFKAVSSTEKCGHNWSELMEEWKRSGLDEITCQTRVHVLKSPAHICRKCLIAFRRVLQWVTSASKSFSRSTANYVSKAKGRATLLFWALYLPPAKPTQICLTEFF